MAERRKDRPALAAAVILIGFGAFAYFMPRIMNTVGAWSPILAVLLMALFMFGLFGVFWLRARYQKRHPSSGE